MPITKLALKPGLIRDTTSYTNEGGWFYSDKIRFRSGSPEKIGGWVRISADTYQGTCTSLLAWTALNGEQYIGCGTNLKFYVVRGGGIYDVTPIRKTTSPLTNNPLTTTISSNQVQVYDVSHGAGINDFVTLSSATGPVNGIPADELNAEHQIIQIVDTDNYKIAVTTTASGSGAGGGAAVVAEYQLNTGLAVFVAGVGFGAGMWGSGGWGGGTTPSVAGQLRLWSQSPFGEDLIFCDLNGDIYYWDSSSGVNTRAVYLSARAGASDVPVKATCVLVTESRHVVAFGCNPYDVPPDTTIDPMLIRWSDQENPVNWTPTVINSSGGYRLTAGSYVMSCRSSRQEVLIWTDTALYSMQYVGGQYVFAFQPLATSITLAGPYATAMVGGTAFWMGRRKFYIYNGTVSTLPCPVLHLLQDNVNWEQAWQITAGTNELFTEIFWFYCSVGSSVIDSYLVYNYGENLWYFGTLGRSAWIDTGNTDTPVAADNVNNVLVYHEVGNDDLSTENPAPITAYIESSDFDLGDGHQFMFISRALPDVSFEGSTTSNPSLNLIVKTRNAPGNTWNSSSNQPSTNPVTRTASQSIYTSPIEQYTPQAWIRLRGRQAAIRIESTGLGVKWQLGALRLDIRPDGRR